MLAQAPSHLLGRGALAVLEQVLEPGFASWASAREPVLPAEHRVPELMHCLAARWMESLNLLGQAQGPAAHWRWTQGSWLVRGQELAWRPLLGARRRPAPAEQLQEQPRKPAVPEGPARAPASLVVSVHWVQERAPA